MKEYVEEIIKNPPCILPKVTIDVKNKTPAAMWERVPLFRSEIPIHGWKRIAGESNHYPQGPEVDIVSWTDEEYENLLKDENWSKEETKNLFELCERFDLKFFVIQDRFESSDRSVEELKDRYYSVTRKLLESRGHASSQYVYDVKRETERKEHLRKLISRPEEEWQKDIDLHLFFRQLQSVWYPIVEAARQSMSYHVNQTIPLRPTIPQLLSSDKDKRKYKKKPPIQLPKLNLASNLSSTSLNSTVTPTVVQKKDKRTTTLFLRSQSVSLSKNSQQQQRLNAQLAEFDLPLAPTMPTEQVCVHYNELLQSIVQLVDLKRQCERYENELKGLNPALGRRPSTLSDDRKRSLSSPGLVPREQKRFRG